MTSRTLHLRDHVQSKSRARVEIQALAAMGFGAAIRFIDAVDPVGTVDPRVYQELGEVFSALVPIEPYIGDEPVEDIAVYLSDRSRMSFSENGVSIGDPALRSSPMPHLAAVRGAVRALQRAHLPFGILTRRALHRLRDYPLLILPNLLRMDEEEMEAVRAYVLGGGRLFASRSTSLTLSDGRRLGNFGLADLFGCDFDPGGLWESGTDAGGGLPEGLAYIEAQDAELARAISPQRLLSHRLEKNGGSGLVALRRGAIDARGEGQVAARAAGHRLARVLATLRLPYGWPDEGSVEDRHWASIHSSPPWTDSGLPVLVENGYGAGRVIYSAADIETVDHWAHEGFFLAVVRRLLGGEASFGAEAHPLVVMNVFHQPEEERYAICFLNHQPIEPVIALRDLAFHLRLPPGLRPRTLVSVPDMRAIEFSCSDSKTLRARLDRLDILRILLVGYGPGG